MMTKEEQIAVQTVYRRFCELDNKSKRWTRLDEFMYVFDWVGDTQIANESEVELNKQIAGKPRCKVDHPIDECFVPTIIDAVTAIIRLYKITKNLPEKNRFVLQYYLSISCDEQIIS